jgi:undecaprenyl-diphosphatase
LNEVGPLLSFLALSLGSWGFVAVAGEVREGDTAALDRTILLSLRTAGDRSDPIGPAWLEEAARDITALGGHTVLTIVTVTVLVYLMLTPRSCWSPSAAGCCSAPG